MTIPMFYEDWEYYERNIRHKPEVWSPSGKCDLLGVVSINTYRLYSSYPWIAFQFTWPIAYYCGYTDGVVKAGFYIGNISVNKPLRIIVSYGPGPYYPSYFYGFVDPVANSWNEVTMISTNHGDIPRGHCMYMTISFEDQIGDLYIGCIGCDVNFGLPRILRGQSGGGLSIIDKPIIMGLRFGNELDPNSMVALIHGAYPVNNIGTEILSHNTWYGIKFKPKHSGWLTGCELLASMFNPNSNRFFSKIRLYKNVSLITEFNFPMHYADNTTGVKRLICQLPYYYPDNVTRLWLEAGQVYRLMFLTYATTSGLRLGYIEVPSNLMGESWMEGLEYGSDLIATTSTNGTSFVDYPRKRYFISFCQAYPLGGFRIPSDLAGGR